MSCAMVFGSCFRWKKLFSAQNPCHHDGHPSHQFMATQTASAASYTTSFHPLLPFGLSTSPSLVVLERKRRLSYRVRAKSGDEEVLKRQRDRKRIEQALPDFAELQKDELQAVLELELESSYNLEEARHYEIVFLIHEACAEEVPAVVKGVKDFISEKKGKIWRLNDWGMRNLAYKIKKARRANYILMNIEISSQAINDLKNLLDKDERVIRHLVMKEKKAMTEPTEPPEEYYPTQAANEDERSTGDEDISFDEGDGEPMEEEEETVGEGGEEEVEEKVAKDLQNTIVLR